MISLASIVTDKKTKTGARQEVITLNTFSRLRLRKANHVGGKANR